MHRGSDLLTPPPSTPLTQGSADIKNGRGPATALFINDAAPKPIPGPGEVLVRIKAFGLNRMDLMQREGNYPVPPQAPATLGVEFSGIVETLGSGAEGFAPGDPVFGLAYGGAYAQYISVSTATLLRKPDGLSWEQAAAIPETWMTAAQALHVVGEFGKEEEDREAAATKSVLWHAGASGVSIAGIQLSRRAGAGAVYATCGSDEKCAFVERELGATRAFNYRTTEEGWDKAVLAATGGRGVHLIVDFVGASYFARNLAVAARDARWVALSFLGGRELPAGVDIAPFLYKRVRLEGSSLRSRDLRYQGALRDRLAGYLPDFASGKLKIFIDAVLPMEDIVKAHQLLEANTTKGKIICTVS